MGKRVIHDTEMTIDEETGVITVKFPGWREDPSKMFSFSPGSGDGFPAAGDTIVFEAGAIAVETEGGGGSKVKGKNLKHTAFAVGGNASATAIIEAIANGSGVSSVNLNVAGLTGLTVQEDGGALRYGVFDKAEDPQIQPDQVDGPVGGAVIDAEARASIEGVIAAMKQLGHMQELV